MARRSVQLHVPYAAVEKHGLIGDRRTAALVSADGTIDWLCLPDYDGDILCGALLDSERGGFWRLGPERLAIGRQSYIADTSTLLTVWDIESAHLELSDAMIWPEQDRPAECRDQRVLVRRLRCVRGTARCLCRFHAGRDFQPAQTPVRLAQGCFLPFGSNKLWLWIDRPCEVDYAGLCADFVLEGGQEILNHGGEWRPEFWQLVRRVADYMARVWQEPGNSIWELADRQHFVCDRVMNWVALDRAVRIAERFKHTADAERWGPIRDRIHRQVMERGWSDTQGAFRQRYEADNLDAANLLIPLVGFLPLDHERVRSTVDRIAESLTIDDFVYRFDPVLTPGVPKPSLPLGEYEGAFLPCTFWLAAVLARQGNISRAERIIRAAEAITDGTHLFAEGVDPRSRTFLGNFPLLFSHVTYLRALRELDSSL